VVVALLRVLAHHAGPLQQVVRDIAASHLTPPVKVDLDEFAKSEKTVFYAFSFWEFV
jgi:hypothetical protein